MRSARPKPPHYQSALSVVALILIVLMGVAAILVQQALKQSQDLRQQASTTKLSRK